MQRAAEGAARVPLNTAQSAVEALRVLALLAKLGNPNARSDAIAGAWLAWASFQGARLNVLANLDGLGDAAKASALRADVDRLAKAAEGYLADARAAVASP
jgi:formiminotetrahydrofolate cyclodeaminase